MAAMIPQFVSGAKLEKLRAACFPLRCIGAFKKLKTDFLDKPEYFAHVQGEYDPARAWQLLEMHCVGSATEDALGDYEASRQFVSPYCSNVEWKVRELLRMEGDGNNLLAENLKLYSSMSWFLQRCAVVEYRDSRYDHARGFLGPAYDLSKRIVSLGIDGSPLDAARERYALHAMNCYWFACVEIYGGNRFEEAEKFLLEGLGILARAGFEEVSSRSAPGESLYELSLDEALNPAPSKQLVAYVSARLLLGLGLLDFFRGRLTDAQANLMTSAVLLRRYSGDLLRLLRCQLLLLSVDRINNKSEKELLAISGAVENLARLFAELKHDRFHWRAMWTLAQVKVDLAKLYDDSRDTKGRERRLAFLNEALAITEDYHQVAASSVTDQLHLDILRIRILRKLERTDDAIQWGLFILQRTSTKDQAFLHTESMLALAHAYYAHFEIQKDKGSLLEAERLLSNANPGGNYRLEAIRTLQLARITNQLGDQTRSLYQLEVWRHLQKLVEYKWISDYAEIVKREIDTGNTIVLPIDSGTEIYKKLHRKLRERLLSDFSKGRPDTEVAEKLGVSRQTLHAWRSEMKHNSISGGKSRRRRQAPSAGRASSAAAAGMHGTEPGPDL